jgi:hypothetical protein
MHLAAQVRPHAMHVASNTEDFASEVADVAVDPVEAAAYGFSEIIEPIICPAARFQADPE